MEQRRTVLLADTSTEFRILLREAMEKTGEFLVEIAQTGDEVLEKVQEQEPDILIMDCWTGCGTCSGKSQKPPAPL